MVRCAVDVFLFVGLSWLAVMAFFGWVFDELGIISRAHARTPSAYVVSSERHVGLR